MRFDLELFEELNRQYEHRPSHTPRSNDSEGVSARGAHRAKWLARRFGVRGKRCLEVGCGRGEVVRALATQYGCDAVGVDIQRYGEWDAAPSIGGQVLVRDIATQPVRDLGRFDLIFSFSVWEHMRHPFEALRAAKKLLAPGGDFYVSANLYRGTQASHRYAEVFFPWPHLLFEDEVFEQFYAKRGKPGMRAAWVNRLTATEYARHFEELGFSALEVSYSRTPIDQEFYQRFEDILSRFPREDLERNFIRAHLRHKPAWRRLSQRLLAVEPGRLTARAGHAARWAREHVEATLARAIGTSRKV
jgi:SAM-dependent methyltransferase